MASATQPNGRARTPRVPLTAAPEPPHIPEPARSAIDRPTPSLDAAVLRVQAAAGKLTRNADGQIQSRFYRYVTLDAVTDEVLPLLVAENLLWKTFPTALDGEPALRYRMTHIGSGEYDEDTMLLLCDRTSQGQGSGDTYARRYSLVAYLNLTVDPDDDGRSANLVPVDRYAEAEADPRVNPGPAEVACGEGRQPIAAPTKPAGRPATVKQRNMLRAKAKGAGLSEGQLANLILAAAEEEQREWRDEDHATQTLTRLLDRMPASLVDAVIAGIAGAGEGARK